jgi:protein-S-isoprenylcysteine O-methyltransferase Ste14
MAGTANAKAFTFGHAGAHSVGSCNAEGRMTKEVFQRPAALPWPPLLFAAAIVAAVGLEHVWPLSWPGLNDLAAQLIGYGLGLAGVALAAWGALAMVRARTNILPHKGADRLITHGAFAFRRNPLYMGETLILLGLGQTTGNIYLVLMAPVFALATLWLAILPEERHLQARFGQAYLDYKERTRRWF